MKTHSEHAVSRKLLVVGSALALSLGFGSKAFAAETEEAGGLESAYEEVTSFSIYGGIRGFNALDRETLIIWKNRSTPYLVELAGPAFDLNFAQAIGIRSKWNRVYSGFDYVLVDGIQYPIKRIFQLSRDDAKSLEADARTARRS